MRIGASLKGFAVIAALVAGAGCKSSATTSVAGPSASRCGVTLSVQPTSFAASGGQGTVSVGTNRECEWDARTEVAWLALSSENAGQGSGTITFSVSSNPVVAERRGAIVVNAQRVEVSQAQAVCVYRLDGTRRAVGPRATVISVAVSAQDGCPWTASSQMPWMTMAAGAAGNGNGVVTIVVAENPEHRRREGSLTIAGQAYVVEQAEAPLPPPPPPAPTPPPPAPTPPPAPAPPPPGPAPPPPAPAPPPPGLHRRRLRLHRRRLRLHRRRLRLHRRRLRLHRRRLRLHRRRLRLHRRRRRRRAASRCRRLPSPSVNRATAPTSASGPIARARGPPPVRLRGSLSIGPAAAATRMSGSRSRRTRRRPVG